MNLLSSSSGQIRSLDSDNNGYYEPELNCHWVIVGRDGKNVQMSFASQFSVEKAQNETDVTCWDYIEVRDGNGPFSPLIGRYCGNAAPSTLRSGLPDFGAVEICPLLMAWKFGSAVKFYSLISSWNRCTPRPPTLAMIPKRSRNKNPLNLATLTQVVDQLSMGEIPERRYD